MKTYIEYALLGQYTEFSKVPVTIGINNEITLDDAMYDLADSPLYQEAIYLGLQFLSENTFAEYWNPVTKLYMRLEDN